MLDKMFSLKIGSVTVLCQATREAEPKGKVPNTDLGLVELVGPSINAMLWPCALRL